jgi:hypothetical protein
MSSLDVGRVATDERVTEWILSKKRLERKARGEAGKWGKRVGDVAKESGK